MKITTAFTRFRHRYITLTHGYSDPTSWIIKRWTKLMWLKIPILTDYFNDPQQAMVFANNIANQHHGKGILHNAV